MLIARQDKHSIQPLSMLQIKSLKYNICNITFRSKKMNYEYHMLADKANTRQYKKRIAGKEKKTCAK
jgi:hypothetical protein